MKDLYHQPYVDLNTFGASFQNPRVVEASTGIPTPSREFLRIQARSKAQESKRKFSKLSLLREMVLL